MVTRVAAVTRRDFFCFVVEIVSESLGNSGYKGFIFFFLEIVLES